MIKKIVLNDFKVEPFLPLRVTSKAST